MVSRMEHRQLPRYERDARLVDLKTVQKLSHVRKRGERGGKKQRCAVT